MARSTEKCSYTALPKPGDALGGIFGHDDFRGVQRDVIDRVWAAPPGTGHALILAPTGSGKSLCYQLPAVARHAAGRGTTLVLSPLIALMQDQVDALAARGIAAAFINSSLSRRHREARYAELAEGRHALVYVTPSVSAKTIFSKPWPKPRSRC